MLEPDGTWSTPPYEGQLGKARDQMRLVGARDLILGLTSEIPHSLYGLAPAQAWKISGQRVRVVGCLGALGAGELQIYGIACQLDLVQLGLRSWPKATGSEIGDANALLDHQVVQSGLDHLYAPLDWTPYLLATYRDVVAVSLARRDRKTSRVEESAIVARDGRGNWRDLMRGDFEVIGLYANGDRVLLVIRDHGKVESHITWLD